MTRAAAWAQEKWPLRCVSTVRSQSSSRAVSTPPCGMMPAQQTIASSRPKSPSARRTARRPPSIVATSAKQAEARPPPARISAAAASATAGAGSALASTLPP